MRPILQAPKALPDNAHIASGAARLRWDLSERWRSAIDENPRQAALLRSLLKDGRLPNYPADYNMFDEEDRFYEIATLAGSLEHMRVELQARLDTIAAQAEELRESSRRIVAAQDGERHRLSRDLHDGLQQQLVVLRMQVGMLEDGDENVGRLGQQLDSVIEQLREVTHNLYPSILVDRGLTAAL